MTFANSRQNQKQTSKLDREVSKKQEREARDRETSSRACAEAASAKERADAAEFRRRIRKFFGRLCGMTKVTISDREAKFKHKNEEYYISYDHWDSPGTGSDGIDMNGDHFCLHRREPYTTHYEVLATDHETIYADTEKQKDMTSKIISALAYFKESEAADGRRGW